MTTDIFCGVGTCWRRPLQGPRKAEANERDKDHAKPSWPSARPSRAASDVVAVKTARRPGPSAVSPGVSATPRVSQSNKSCQLTMSRPSFVPVSRLPSPRNSRARAQSSTRGDAAATLNIFSGALAATPRRRGRGVSPRPVRLLSRPRRRRDHISLRAPRLERRQRNSTRRSGTTRLKGPSARAAG